MSALRLVVAVLFSVGLAVNAAAQPGKGALKVTSYPSGAAVSIDGVSTGKVTPMSASLAVGQHTVIVEVTNSGWNADERTVTIGPGNNDLSVTLLPNATVGPEGPMGPAGPPGPPGPAGPSGVASLLYFTEGMAPGTSVARAFCPTGTKVVGGGGISINQKGLAQNFPISDASGAIAFGSTAIGWQVAAADWSAVQAFVICVGP